MIYAKQADAARYLGGSQAMDTALRLLEKGLGGLKKGRNEVDGDQVFINYMEYTTLREEETAYEAHLDYVDIHVLLSGEEQIKVVRVEDAQEFERDESADYVGYHGEAQATVTLRPGEFLAVWPGEAHMVKLQVEGPTENRKAVFKVKA